jgi:hypothetical protein
MLKDEIIFANGPEQRENPWHSQGRCFAFPPCFSPIGTLFLHNPGLGQGLQPIQPCNSRVSFNWERDRFTPATDSFGPFQGLPDPFFTFLEKYKSHPNNCQVFLNMLKGKVHGFGILPQMFQPVKIPLRLAEDMDHKKAVIQ